MISLTSTQIDAWIVAFVFPLTRILAFVATAPLFSSVAVPRRIRLTLGLVITVAITPALPPMPAVEPSSGIGLGILAQQLLVGVGMGFAMRIVYAAIDIAGEFISFQMGLGFATFYDPINTAQTPVIAEFINLLALLVFLSINGHLIYVATLMQSFSVIPISVAPLAANSWGNLAELGSAIFSTGLLLALPVIVALMIANIALGVLTKAAPQLNIFALGFPLTLTGGFFAMAITLNYLAVPLQRLLEYGLAAMLGFAQLKH
jgi:flagellar biosynthetic protein FliR